MKYQLRTSWWNDCSIILHLLARKCCHMSLYVTRAVMSYCRDYFGLCYFRLTADIDATLSLSLINIYIYIYIYLYIYIYISLIYISLSLSHTLTHTFTHTHTHYISLSLTHTHTLTYSHSSSLFLWHTHCKYTSDCVQRTRYLIRWKLDIPSHIGISWQPFHSVKVFPM